ncbi:hypothetical protein THAOC_24580, partial [Thalassiosira oceanica]
HAVVCQVDFAGDDRDDGGGGDECWYQIEQLEERECPTCWANIPTSKELIQRADGFTQLDEARLGVNIINAASNELMNGPAMKQNEAQLNKMIEKFTEQGYSVDKITGIMRQCGELGKQNFLPLNVVAALGWGEEGSLQVVMDCLGPWPVDKAKLEAICPTGPPLTLLGGHRWRRQPTTRRLQDCETVKRILIEWGTRLNFFG